MIIQGSDINLGSPDLARAKSLADLKKLQIFNHLSKEDEAKANQELWEVLNPGKKSGKEVTEE